MGTIYGYPQRLHIQNSEREKEAAEIRIMSRELVEELRKTNGRKEERGEEYFRQQAKEYFRQSDKQESKKEIGKDLVKPVLIIGLILWCIGLIIFSGSLL